MQITAQEVKIQLKGAELLTGKQRAFAEFYVANYPDCTKQEAARHAGYAETTTGKCIVTGRTISPKYCLYL